MGLQRKSQQRRGEKHHPSAYAGPGVEFAPFGLSPIGRANPAFNPEQQPSPRNAIAAVEEEGAAVGLGGLVDYFEHAGDALLGS